MLDGVNLGWKLAFAARADGRDRQPLCSYDRERRPVARQVLALTHMVFFAEASTHPLAAMLRERLVPLAAPALPALLRQRLPMAVVVRLLSQCWVRYGSSLISIEGIPGGRGPRPGDRLPDQEVTSGGRQGRLHDLTARPGIHVLLERDSHAQGRSAEALAGQVTVHRITSWPGRGLIAVRPDAHAGFRCRNSDPDLLRDWLDLVGARRQDRVSAAALSRCPSVSAPGGTDRRVGAGTIAPGSPCDSPSPVPSSASAQRAAGNPCDERR